MGGLRSSHYCCLNFSAYDMKIKHCRILERLNKIQRQFLYEVDDVNEEEAFIEAVTEN